MKFYATLAASVVAITGFDRAANASQCTFNGSSEPCQVARFNQSDTTPVVWSDGKIATYTRFGCVDYNCSVRIVEDNGRVTYGAGTFGPRGFAVKSNRGNITNITY